MDENEKIYRMGGNDPRTGEERLAALITRGLTRPKPGAKQAKPQPKRPGFGEPPEMSEEQKARLRVLRRQAAGG